MYKSIDTPVKPVMFRFEMNKNHIDVTHFLRLAEDDMHRKARTNDRIKEINDQMDALIKERHELSAELVWLATAPQWKTDLCKLVEAMVPPFNRPPAETEREKLVKRIEACIDEAKSRNERIVRFELDGKQFRTLNVQNSPYSLSGTYAGYPVVMAMKFDCITEPKHHFKVGDSVVAKSRYEKKRVGEIRSITCGLSRGICVDYGTLGVSYYNPEELTLWNP